MALYLQFGEKIELYNYDKESTISDITRFIENKYFIPQDMFSINTGTKMYTSVIDFSTNLDDEFDTNDCLQIIPVVLAGMRAKWRKKRTRRLKRKRRKMRQRAR